jgi:hypothetical protein
LLRTYWRREQRRVHDEIDSSVLVEKLEGELADEVGSSQELSSIGLVNIISDNAVSTEPMCSRESWGRAHLDLLAARREISGEIPDATRD